MQCKTTYFLCMYVCTCIMQAIRNYIHVHVHALVNSVNLRNELHIYIYVVEDRNNIRIISWK